MGNGWTESGTTTWSSIGSSSVGTLLSSLYVRYGQGNVSGENQRYAFDITALAKKWANGTASPSKGVIFKATDSYESGGTNTYRTFASINRGSNPPILTVEYSSTTASISLNKTSATLYLNDTLQLSATTTPGGSVVSWTSSDPAIASVSTSGLVSAHTVGSATITATANGVSASCTVTVRKGSIVINKPTDSVLVGGTIQLTATTTPGGRTVSWSSSDTSIATVHSSGLVTFSRSGTVTVTASAAGLNPQTVTLYGIISDGVYNLKNAGSRLYVRMEGNNLFQIKGTMAQNGVDNPLTDVSMMWRIHYIGSGRYTIRSYANPARAIGGGGATGVEAFTSSHILPNDQLNEYYGVTQWYISQDHPSYYILTNALTEKILSVPAGNETTGTLLTLSDEAGTISDSNRRWMLEPLSSVPTGIFLYRYHDEGSQVYTTAFTKTSMTLEVGEYRRIKAIYRDPDNISQSFTWSVSNTGVATHDGVDKITAVDYGNAVVSAKHSNGNSFLKKIFTIEVPSSDPLHTTNIEYIRYTRIIGNNFWGLGSQTDHTLAVIKSKLSSDTYFIATDNINGNISREYVIGSALKNTLNDLENQYQNHYNILPILNTTTEEENYAHYAKEETDQLVDSGYILYESDEYYGAWAYNYSSLVNIIALWRGTIDVATKAYLVYLSITSYYNSYLVTQNVQSTSVNSSQYKSISSSLDQLDDALTGINYTNKCVITAEERNAALSNTYANPPYKAGTPVIKIQTTESSQFVRVYGNGTNQAGKWIMRYSDIQGLTAAEIQQKFALPNYPTHYCYVNVPEGTIMYSGIVEENFGYVGEGIQFEIYGQIPEESFCGEFDLP